MIPEEDAERHVRVQRRARQKLIFYQHAAFYLVFGAFVSLVNRLSHDTASVYWALMGWGLAVIAHGLLAFRPKRAKSGYPRRPTRR